jgi:hypothetical protein
VTAGLADSAAALASSSTWAPSAALGGDARVVTRNAFGGAIRAVSLRLLVSLQERAGPNATSLPPAVRGRLGPLALSTALDAVCGGGGDVQHHDASAPPGAARCRGVGAALLSISTTDVTLKRRALARGALPALVAVAGDAACYDGRTRGRALAGAGNVAYVAAHADVAGMSSLTALLRAELARAADALPLIAARRRTRGGGGGGKKAHRGSSGGARNISPEEQADEDDAALQLAYNAAFAALQLAPYEELRDVLAAPDVLASLHKMLAAAAAAASSGGGGGRAREPALPGFVALLQGRLLPALAAAPVAAMGSGMNLFLPPAHIRDVDPTEARCAFTPASRDAPAPPLAAHDTRALLRAVCCGCGARDDERGSMRKCGRCLTARYCSEACQRAHWAAHKPACVRAPPPAE